MILLLMTAVTASLIQTRYDTSMYVYKKFEFYRFQSLSNKRKDNETGDDVVIGGPRVSSVQMSSTQ